jgi:hypothetical protein
MSDFVIRQANDDGPAMNVQVTNGVIANGAAGVAFDNDGGFLNLVNVDVQGVAAAGLIATANNGISILENADIRASSLDSVTFTTASGVQTVQGTTVSDMQLLDDVFFVEDVGSTLNVVESTIRDNDISGGRFKGVNVMSGGVAVVKDFLFENNAGVEFGAVAAGDGSRISITDSEFNMNTGLANSTSASVLGITDSTVTIERVQFNQNTQFTVSDRKISFDYHRRSQSSSIPFEIRRQV